MNLLLEFIISNTIDFYISDTIHLKNERKSPLHYYRMCFEVANPSIYGFADVA